LSELVLGSKGPIIQPVVPTQNGTIALPEHLENARWQRTQLLAHWREFCQPPVSPARPSSLSQQLLAARGAAGLLAIRFPALDICRRSANRARHPMPAARIHHLPANESCGYTTHDAAHQRLLESELVGDLALRVNLFAVEAVAHAQDGPIAFSQFVESRGWQSLQGEAKRRQHGLVTDLLSLATAAP
jgi:hypothetical protein